MGVNYGLNKGLAPVPVGSKVRLTATLKDVEEVLEDHGRRVIEAEGGKRSASPSRSSASTAVHPWRPSGRWPMSWPGCRRSPPPLEHALPVADLWPSPSVGLPRSWSASTAATSWPPTAGPART